MNQVRQSLLEEPVWLEIARRELGVSEGKDDRRIVAYHQATRLKAQSSRVPWCASFVSYCLEQAGVPSLRSARAADYATYGRETYLEPGAVIVFDRASPDAGGSGHVSFLVGVDGADLLCLGGNQRNSVRISRYPAERMRACRWPMVS